MFANILWKINFSLPLWKIVSTAMAPDFSNIFSCFGLQALREGADGADHEEPHPRLLLIIWHVRHLPKLIPSPLVCFTILLLYPGFVRYSALPCSPLPGVAEHHLLSRSTLTIHSSWLRCEWRGEVMDCSDIFDTSPTDSGMCCSFNMEKTLRWKSFRSRTAKYTSTQEITVPRSDWGDAEKGSHNKEPKEYWRRGSQNGDGFVGCLIDCECSGKNRKEEWTSTYDWPALQWGK